MFCLFLEIFVEHRFVVRQPKLKLY